MMLDARQLFVTTSWDDGTASDLRLAELLSKHGLPATFYVARRHPYGSLPEHHVRELGQSFELGAHTLNHVVLDSVPNELAEMEIRGSKSWIEQLSGRPCEVFCFPRGRFSGRHVKVARDAGFIGARTVELMSSRITSRSAGLVLMATTVQAFPHKPSAYVRNIVRRGRISNLFTYLHADRQSWTTMAESLLTRMSSHGGVFHLWGHAWEIEQLKLWRDLEQLFHTIGQYKTQARFVDNADLCAGVAA